MKDLELKDVVSVGSDIAALIRVWRNSDGVRKKMLSGHIISEDEHRQWLDSFRTSEGKRGWVIYWRGRPVGFMQLTEIDKVAGSADWGIYIGEENSRGRGIGRSALLWLIGFGFSDLRLHHLRTKVFASNEAALSLYRSVGFSEEGRESLLREGRKLGVILLSMNDADWKKGAGGRHA